MSAVVIDDRRRAPDQLGRLVRTLRSWLYLRVEPQDGWVALRSGVREVALGVVDLDTGALTANVPLDMLGSLLEEHRQLQPTEDGVTVRVTDVASRRAAEALIRRRIEFERYAPQLHNASP
jgi:hypothetical protein